jgi:hypothetical protein
MATQRIACGHTPPGATDWKNYPPLSTDTAATGIYVDVDTTAGKFSSVPAYVTSIGGSSSHWNTTGATSVYGPNVINTLPTATGFRVYVRWASGNNAINKPVANGFNWHINWIGMEI